MSERRRSLFILLLVAGLIIASAVAVATKPTKLGLDLKGGVQLVYQAKPTPQQKTITQDSLARAIDIMRQRVDAFGVAEPEISQLAANGIQVNLPGVSDAQRAADQVGSTAQLFLYDWEANILDSSCKTNPNENSNQQQPVTGLFNAVKQASKCPPKDFPNSNAAAAPRFYVFNKVTHKPLANGQNFDTRASALQDLTPQDRANAQVIEVPKGILVVQDEKASATAPAPDAYWVIQDDPGLSGTDITDPKQSFDQTSSAPIVTFSFTKKGRQEFQAITRRIAQRGQDNALPGQDPTLTSQHFAIVLDNQLISAPYINFQENPDGIDGSTGAQISGGFTLQSAQDLAKILQIGALPVKLDLISRSQVSASLGQQALNQGLIAGLAGFAVVALFLIGFYRMLGLIATVALAIYALYFYALIKVIPITMTLPGIAGLILTIGVAADANIVVFERVKEEVRAGRSVGQAIVSGYRKGLTAIIDANIVTFLVAFILFILATAGVKGFAFTLGLGVIVSLFTAVLATQAILYSLRGTRLIRSRAALGVRQRVRFRWDYMGKSRYFFTLSGVILLVGALAISGKGINFGIDFSGGTRLTTGLDKPATVEQIRSAITPQGLADAKIQTIKNDKLGPNAVQITTESLGKQGIDGVERALDKAYGIRGTPNEEEIGPSFGQSVAKSALIAIIASLIVISIYIALRFEWKFAVPVLIALMHDVLIVSGVYALTGREVTTSTVAALLTILGFSLYDTIIVFDRVRENIPRMPSAAFSQIVNRAMSEVITRSLATSFSTLLPVLALLLFGGDTLKDFAFALLVGIASGTYSSIFIASPVLTHWKERETVYRTREQRIRRDLGEVPAYATTAQGGPIDVAPPERRRSAASVAQDPSQGVSQTEFADMVRNLGIDEERRPPEPAATGPQRPAGGRRARARAAGGTPPPRPPGQPKGGDGSPPPPRDGEGDGAPRDRKPRNRRHGRPR